MEELRDLRAKCQAGKGSGPKGYVIHRKLSIYITRVLLRTNASPTLITFTMMGLGLAGVVLVASPDWKWNVTGFLILYVSFLLDKVDGEIARFKELQSVRGILLDRFHHRLIEPCLFPAVALHEMRSGGSPVLLAIGFATAMLANVIEEHQQLVPYILTKHLRETGSLPVPRERYRSTSRLNGLAKLLRPLKMFRMFIVAVPAFALCYLVQGIFYWPAPAYYLQACAAGLLLYVVFQCVYYFQIKLDSEIDSLLERFPGLNAVAPAPPGVVASRQIFAPEKEARGGPNREANGPRHDHPLGVPGQVQPATGQQRDEEGIQ